MPSSSSSEETMIGIEGIIDKTRSDLRSGSGKKLQDSLEKGSFRNKLKSEIGNGVPARKLIQEKKLKDACTEMESLFVNSMFKEMRKTIHKSDWLHGGYAEEIFEDMLYEQYSLNLSKNSSMGLAKMLYDEMKKKI